MATINGTANDYTIVVGTEGHDTINGTDGWDRIHGGGGNDTIGGGFGFDIINGGDGDDVITDYQDATEVNGGAGKDTIRTGEMGDLINGGSGDDVIYAGPGSIFGDRIYDGPGNDRVYGEGDEDLIYGSAGNDYYDGGTEEGLGWDRDGVTYQYALAGVFVNLGAASDHARSREAGDKARIGIDQLVNMEGVSGSPFNDILIASGRGDGLAGLAGNDDLRGGSGGDSLAGGDGNDILDGAGGNDSAGYSSSEVGVRVSLATTSRQQTGQGADILKNIEHLVGSFHGDQLSGNGGANILDGLTGDDRLFGAGGTDELWGGDGRNYLDGGAGADRMYGAAGDDTYVVDHADEVILEDEDGGEDTVRSSISFVLPEESWTRSLENLTLTGTRALSGTGNANSNIIIGNDAANVLLGLGGDDRLMGGGGKDRLSGGAGDDTYVIGGDLDWVVEDAGQGIDTVRASAGHSLAANVENLTLTGTFVTEGRGNVLDNVVTGNAGSNRLFGLAGDDDLIGHAGDDILEGGAGVDAMKGGTGNDIYVVGAPGEELVEYTAQGIDTVLASVTWTLGAHFERLTLGGANAIGGTGNSLRNIIKGNDAGNSLTAGAGDDVLFGAGGGDILHGGTGSDWLEGGAGRDRSEGGAGADRFVFREGDFSGTSALSCDVVEDFGDAEGDRIHLTLIDADANAVGNQAFTSIGSNAFTGGAGELRWEQVGRSTVVEGDVDGDGAADFAIRLAGLHVLGADDFFF